MENISYISFNIIIYRNIMFSLLIAVLKLTVIQFVNYVSLFCTNGICS